MNDDETIFVNKHPGTLGDRVDNVSDHFGQRGTLLYHSGKPDWVRHPITGERLRVTNLCEASCTCPECNTAGRKRILEAQTDDGPIYAMDCRECRQFVWYTIAPVGKDR